MDVFSEIEARIRALEGRLARLVAPVPEADRLPARWSYDEDVLQWQVLLVEEILEPDVDVEILSTALVLRACPLADRARTLIAVLPIPDPFDGRHPRIRVLPDRVEIRVGCRKGGAS